MTSTIHLDIPEDDGSRVICYGVEVVARRDASTGAWSFVDGYFDCVEMDLGMIQHLDDGTTLRTNTKVVLPLDLAAPEDRWKVERFIKQKWWDRFREAFEREWEQQMEASR